MVEQVIEAKETLHAKETQVRVTKGSAKVFFSVVVPGSSEGTPVVSEGLTREGFEGALDRVSRPTGRGKLAHLRPNSEEFARRKQEEIDLEERSR